MNPIFLITITATVSALLFFSIRFLSANTPAKKPTPGLRLQKNHKLPSPVYVTKPHLPEKRKYIKAIETLWQTQQLTNSGPVLCQFETEVAKYLTVPYASAYVNGHCALEAALRALNLTGEVITTAFTFPSTIHALTLNNLKPVFCDITLDNYNIDHTKIEALITEKTSAILAVHVFGNPCELQALQDIANRHNLKLIYDAAHAFGVKVNDQGIGQFGDVSIFSLHATKVFHTVEGGLVTFREKKYQRIFSMLRNFGYADNSDDIEIVGANMKMSELHAAMGILNLENIDELLQQRREIYQWYYTQLNGSPGLTIVEKPDSIKSNYAYCAIEIDKNSASISRDTLCHKLADYNIFPRKYFYPLCTDFSCYKNESFYKQKLENARKISDNILCLPIYPELDQQTVKFICDRILLLLSSKADITDPNLKQLTE